MTRYVIETAKTVLMKMLAVIFLLATVSAAFAQERVLSLSEALEYAMGGNPALRAATEGLLAKKEEIGIARSLLLPKLVFEEKFMKTNNPVYVFMSKLNEERFTAQDFAVDSLNHPQAVNDFQSSLSFEQAIFSPKANIGLDMAKKEFAAQDDELGRKKEDVAFRVFKAYMGVQTAKSYVTSAEKGVQDDREHERIAQARFRADLGLFADTLRAKVALASAEERLVAATKNLDVAKRALGLALGLTESIDVTSERPAFEVKPIEYYYDASRSRRDLKSFETRYDNARNMLRMANAGYLPFVGVGGAYQLNDHNRPFGTEGDSWQVGAFLRWELFDGAKREHERQKAKHRIAETGENLAGFRKELSFKVFEAYRDVEAAKKGLDLAKAAVESAEEGRRLVRLRYENSLSPMVDLLDAQASLDASRADAIEKENAYLTAIANLDFQSGIILKDLGVGR